MSANVLMLLSISILHERGEVLVALDSFGGPSFFSCWYLAMRGSLAASCGKRVLSSLYLCLAPGILLMLEVTLNALVLICVVSSYFVLAGFSAGMAGGGFGGGYYPFEGQELQQVRELDQRFTVMRAPLLYGGLTVSVIMGALTLAVLAAGSKHLMSLSKTWLWAEAAFCTLASLGYGAAVGVFLHFALQINATDLCKMRERLYARNGLTWMNCDLAGTDGGAATFGILLIILYAASVVLTFRAYRQKLAFQR